MFGWGSSKKEKKEEKKEETGEEIKEGWKGNLTEDQQKALEAFQTKLKAHIKELHSQGIRASKKEKILASDTRTHLRFLRARTWDVDVSFEMFVECGKFRREFHGVGVEAIKEEDFINELKCGKFFYWKHDKQNRPISYVTPRLHVAGANDIKEIENYTIYCCEKGRELLKLPQEQCCVVYDMNGFGYGNMDRAYTKFMIHTLANFYPESLGQCLIVNAPFIFYSIWAVISQLINPVSREKIKFINMEELPKYIDAEDIPTAFAGNDPFSFSYTPPSERSSPTDGIPTWDMEWTKEIKEKNKEIDEQILREDVPLFFPFEDDDDDDDDDDSSNNNNNNNSTSNGNNEKPTDTKDEEDSTANNDEDDDKKE